METTKLSSMKEYTRDHEDMKEALDAPDLEEEELVLLDDELYVNKDEGV